VPYGLAGGRKGTPSRNVLNPGTAERELPAKCTLTVRHGDVYRHELAGAGDWGDPFARDPERVLRDVMEEKISPAYARPARSSSYPDPPSFQVKSVMLIR
jgi:N-methylhydantoinase B